MSHDQQRAFFATVRRHLPEYFSDSKVIEIGSLDINGSCRQFFERADYCGVDLSSGPGVDKVMAGQMVDFPSGHFDVSLSADCFEHNPYWLETFVNMARMTRGGGLVLMTCATTGRGEHGTTRSSPESSPFTVAQDWDYYRNLTETDFLNRIALENWFQSWRFFIDHTHYDLYFVGIRGNEARTGIPDTLIADLSAQTSPYRSLKTFKRSIKIKLFRRFIK